MSTGTLPQIDVAEVRRHVDVNEAFRQERADWINGADQRLADANAAIAQQNADTQKRIDDGKLIPIGNGRYQVNEPGSWDNGEVWQTMRQPLTGLYEIMPVHGLAERKSGGVSLYSSTPAWHSLGQVIPGGISSVDEVMKLGGLDFDVAMRPVLFQTEQNGPTHVMPDRWVVTHEHTGEGLAVVGTRYQPIQNRTAFGFLQDMVDDYDVKWESAGALRNGRRVFISMRMPENIIIDPQGIADEIVPFIVAVNSHDGSTLFQVVVTPWRPVCGNTERFALRDATASWGVRHTSGAPKRSAEARNTLGLTFKYYEAFEEQQNALAQTEMALKDFQAVMDQVWEAPEDDAPVRTVNYHQRRKDALISRWTENSEKLGQTAYAAERAFTEYLDWDQMLRPTGALKGRPGAAVRATAMVEGTSDGDKNKVHRQLLLRTNK